MLPDGQDKLNAPQQKCNQNLPQKHNDQLANYFQKKNKTFPHRQSTL